MNQPSQNELIQMQKVQEEHLRIMRETYELEELRIKNEINNLGIANSSILNVINAFNGAVIMCNELSNTELHGKLGKLKEDLAHKLCDFVISPKSATVQEIIPTITPEIVNKGNNNA